MLRSYGYKTMRILPRYKKCFVCGIENSKGLKLFFYEENNQVCLDFTGTDDYIGYGDRIHGGIIATIMDETMGWAPYIITDNLYYTWDMNIRYLHPVPAGKPVKFIAWMKEDKKRYVVTEGKVVDEEGKIYIKATGKYAPMSEENKKEVFSYLEHHCTL